MRYLAFPLCLLALSTPIEVSAQSQSVQPFVTNVQRETLHSSYERKDIQVLVPTEEKIDFAWSDQPFAIHIPVSLPQSRTVAFEVQFGFRGFKADGGQTLHFSADKAGLYFADRRQIGRTSPGWNGELKKDHIHIQAWGPGTFWPGYVESNPNVFNARAIALQMPAAGQVVLYAPIYPQKSGLKNEFWTPELRGEFVIRVNYIRMLPPDIDQYEDQPVPSEVIFPFTVRQNGWRLTQPTIENSQDALPNNSAPRFHLSEGGTNWSGGKLSATTTITPQRAYPGEAVGPITHEFELQLPPTIHDYRLTQSGRLLERLTRHESKVVSGYVLRDDNEHLYLRSTRDKNYRFDQDGVYGWEREKEVWPDLHQLGKRAQLDEYLKTFDSIEPLGEQPLCSYEYRHGPFRKKITFNGMRLSEVESNLSGRTQVAVATQRVETPDDGYYTWLDPFLDEAEETFGMVEENRTVLSSLHHEMRRLRHQVLSLLQAYMRSSEMPADIRPGFGDRAAQIGQAVADGIRGVERARGPRPSIGPRWSPGAVTASKREQDRLRAQIREYRTLQEKIMTETLAKVDALLTSVEGQLNKTKLTGRKQALTDLRDKLQNQRDIMHLTLYDAAGWYQPDEMPKLIEEFDTLTTAAREVAKLFEIKAKLAYATQLEEKLAIQVASPMSPPPGSPLEMAAKEARYDALYSLNEFLQENPGHKEARLMRQELELRYLQMVMAKVERERQTSLAGFRNYLEKRGYDVEQPMSWPQGVWEFVKVYWGSGPITLLGALPGFDTPGAVADATIVQQEETARDMISFLAISRLLKNDMTLAEIGRIDTETLATRMHAHRADLKPMLPHLAWPLAQDIHATYAGLAELRSIAAAEVDDFKYYHGQHIYLPLETDQCWGEYVGDIFSPRHLITLFAPHAIASVGGQQAGVRLLSGQQVAALERAGEITRGQEAFVATISASRAGQWLTGLPMATRLQRVLLADRDYIEALKGWEKVKAVSGRLFAAMVLYGGAGHLADQSGVPAIRLLIDAIFELGSQGIFTDVLVKSGAARQQVTSRIDDYLRFLEKEEAELKKLAEVTESLERLADKAKPSGAGAPPLLAAPDQAEAGRLSQVFGKRSKTSQSLSRRESAKDAINRAGELLYEGDTEGAKRALAYSKKAVAKEREQVANEVQRSKKAASLVATEETPLVPTQPALVATAAGGPAQHGVLTRKTTQKPFWAEARVYREKPYGVQLLNADEALRVDDFEEAARMYRHAKRKAEMSGDAAGVELIEERLALLARIEREAAEQAQRQGNAGALTALEEITDDHLDEFQRHMEEVGELTKNSLESMNDVFFFIDEQGVKWWFKRFDNAENEVTEAAGTALAQAVGLKSPSMRRVSLGQKTIKVKDAKTGQVVKQTLEIKGVLMRNLDGEMVMDAADEAAIALKKDYAAQRAFRIWLGDTDGHYGNQMISSAGGFWPIDFGFAQLGKAVKFGLKQLSDWTPGSTREFLEMAASLHGYLQHSQYQWIRRMDEMIHYDQMADTVEAIKDLCQRNGGEDLRNLLQQSVPEDQLDEAVEDLIERAGLLEEVLRARFGQGIPVVSIIRLPLYGEPTYGTLRLAA